MTTNTSSTTITYSLSGGVTTIVTQPIWNFKTIIQSGQRGQLSGRQCIPKLWTGTVLSATTNATTIGIRGSMYESLSRKLAGSDEPGMIEELSAAFASGCTIGGSFNTVNDNICNRKTFWTLKKVQEEKSLTYWQTALKMYRLHGLGAFSRGFHLTAARDGGFSVGLFYLSDRFSEEFEPYTSNKHVADLLGGFAGGFFAALSTHPLDTMKTRSQSYQPIVFTTKELMRGFSMRLCACMIMTGVFKGILGLQQQQE